MENAATGEVAAVMVLTGVHIDTAARRSCPMPPEIVSAAQKMVVPGFGPGV
ncbi:thioesterase family protein [Streptomyces sp. NBC_00510]